MDYDIVNSDCPFMQGCPFPELTSKITEDCWKFLYCYADSYNGYDRCARYQHRTGKNEKPPKNLMPDGKTEE